MFFVAIIVAGYGTECLTVRVKEKVKTVYLFS